MRDDYVMTWHCYTHDVDVPARTECPECRADEAAEHRRRSLEQQEEAQWEAETQHFELQRSLSENAYKRANPGDYECPHCKYISLKRGASRCPLCHGEVGSEFWQDLRNRETARDHTQPPGRNGPDWVAELNRNAWPN